MGANTEPMKNIALLLLILPFGIHANSPFWSKTGHRVVGEVAQQHLSRKARKAITDLLGGEGLAEVANYADAIKSDPKYRAYGPWHYVNFGPNERYGDSPPSTEGDIIQGIESCRKVLMDANSSREDKVFHLKMLVHLLGDLHQPMHIGRAEDRGGNDIQLQWFDNGTNLHRVWDANLINSHGMSYTELAASLPRWSRKKIRDVQQGTVLEWVEEIHQITNKVYASVEVGQRLSYRYSYDWWNTVEQQLLTGGLRLAAVLNEIFS